MRVWGRTYNVDGTWQWVAVTTAPDGNNDNVYITNLIQVLKLNLGESPFYANYGIPAERSVMTQISPDFYVAQTQQQFSQFFASLVVSRLASPDGITPQYSVNVITNQGTIIPNAGSKVPT